MAKVLVNKQIMEKETKSGLPQGGDNLNWGQKWPKAIRPQIPRDASQMGQPRWTPGTLPKGGFRSVFDFSTGPESTKLSPTSGGGKKVY
jgi:hypothetical protein